MPRAIAVDACVMLLLATCTANTSATPIAIPTPASSSWMGRVRNLRA
jgi:outer membrane biogenesis lipoprotein LolB